MAHTARPALQPLRVIILILLATACASHVWAASNPPNCPKTGQAPALTQPLCGGRRRLPANPDQTAKTAIQRAEASSLRPCGACL